MTRDELKVGSLYVFKDFGAEKTPLMYLECIENPVEMKGLDRYKFLTPAGNFVEYGWSSVCLMRKA